MIAISEKDALKNALKGWRQAGESVCLVPTMGYFHKGHLALMEMARKTADRVVVSLFVNPTQFGPGEDLDNYPNDHEGDFEKARDTGADMIFCPRSDQMYSTDHQSSVSVSHLSKDLCGKDRPNHFRGVTTVVTKLFNLIQPDYAVFGEKDFQQLAVIRQMVKDLNFPVEILGHPIVREDDGLAMSSRNVYLDEKERKAALALYNALCFVKDYFSKPEQPQSLHEIIEEGKSIIRQNKQCSIDYFTVVDAATLEIKERFTENCRAMGAMKINNRVRLIDNIQIS